MGTKSLYSSTNQIKVDYEGCAYQCAMTSNAEVTSHDNFCRTHDCSIRKTEVRQGAGIFRLHGHGPAENVFPHKSGYIR